MDFQSEYAHINNGPSSLLSTNNIVKPKHRLQHPITQTKNINRVIKHQRLYNSSTINTIRTNMQLLAIPNTRFHLRIPSITNLSFFFFFFQNLIILNPIKTSTFIKTLKKNLKKKKKSQIGIPIPFALIPELFFSPYKKKKKKLWNYAVLMPLYKKQKIKTRVKRHHFNLYILSMLVCMVFLVKGFKNFSIKHLKKPIL